MPRYRVTLLWLLAGGALAGMLGPRLSTSDVSIKCCRHD